MSTLNPPTYRYIFFKNMILYVVMACIIWGIYILAFSTSRQGTSTSDLLLSGGIFGGIGLAIILIGLLWSWLYVVLLAKNYSYDLQDNALIIRKGLLSVSTISIPFARIINATYSQSIFQRIFAVGTIKIDQEDTSYSWNDIDMQSSDKIMNAVSHKSNIQPISTNIKK